MLSTRPWPSSRRTEATKPSLQLSSAQDYVCHTHTHPNLEDFTELYVFHDLTSFMDSTTFIHKTQKLTIPCVHSIRTLGLRSRSKPFPISQPHFRKPLGPSAQPGSCSCIILHQLSGAAPYPPLNIIPLLFTQTLLSFCIG